MGITQKTLSLFWRENLRHKPLFLGTCSLWLAGMILQKLGMPLVIAAAIDKLISVYDGFQGDYWQIFAPYVIVLVIVGAVAQVFISLGLVLLSKLETKARPALQNRIFGELVGRSLHFHANTFSGALVAKVNRFTGSYITLTDNFVLTVLRMATNVVIAIAVIAFFAPIIAIAMLTWTVFFTWLNVVLTRKRMHLSRIAAAADSVLTAHLADSMGNIAAVKAFANENSEASTHRVKARDYADKKYASWIKAIQNDVVFGVLMTTLQIMVLVLSIVAVMQGSITIGVLLLVQIYVTQLIGELWGLSGLSRTLEQALSNAGEMTEILHEDNELVDPKHPEKVRVQQGAITMTNMSFTHADSKQGDVLFHDFNLAVKAGERIGLVGHSGSGKTTLTKLLLRFNDIDNGAIKVDGQDIAHLRQADLRARIAYVPQEPALFHRSLRENIAYGKPDASNEEITEAAKKAHALEFIGKLSHGFDTLVGERGVKLSGGQRQRIAIARAILKNAPILVLDEATSALDSESERLIQIALGELMKNRTSIVIAHRLSTVQKMDRIVVFEDGRIIEEGSHTQLLAKKGTYASLWNHQSGGFMEE